MFVFMEYVGYLRRNPDAAGFVFWLGKLEPSTTAIPSRRRWCVPSSCRPSIATASASLKGRG